MVWVEIGKKLAGTGPGQNFVFDFGRGRVPTEVSSLLRARPGRDCSHAGRSRAWKIWPVQISIVNVESLAISFHLFIRYFLPNQAQKHIQLSSAAHRSLDALGARFKKPVRKLLSPKIIRFIGCFFPRSTHFYSFILLSDNILWLLNGLHFFFFFFFY